MRAAQLSPRDRDRGRLLAQAAYVSATVTGELPLIRGLLAESRRAARGQGGSAEPDGSLHAAVADACLLLNGSDDIDTVHRLLTGAVRTWPAAPHACGGALIATLETLLTVCTAGGRPALWEPFDAALGNLVRDSCPELDLLACASTAS